MHEHATKPATLSAALSDSPAGLAAWIAEKIVAWSSRPDGTPAFDRDLLLATLTLWSPHNHLVAAALLGHNHVPGAGIPAGDPSPMPTAVTIFGGERVPFPKPRRELAERYYNVTAWSEHDRGGHFPLRASTLGRRAPARVSPNAQCLDDRRCRASSTPRKHVGQTSRPRGLPARGG
jgi:hypothetical protein